MKKLCYFFSFGLISILFVPSAQAKESTKSSAECQIHYGSVVREVVHVQKGKSPTPVRRRFDSVVLENQYLALTFCPELGERIVRLVDKLTGRQLLYEGLIKYSGSALTEGGGSGGGLQINHPYYHAGSSYVVPLPYFVEMQEDGTAKLTLVYTSYPHLQRTIWQISLRADEAGFRSNYQFENLAPYSMGFNPWINAAFPLRKDVQFILPTEWVTGHWFGINPQEEFGNWLRPWPISKDGKDQSYIDQGKESSVFSYGIHAGYSGAYFHDTNDGLARVFDPAKMPGAKMAGVWKPKPRGWDWCELWGAFSHNMEDPLWLGPHETIRASDMWFPIHGIGGMSWASEQGAIHLKKHDTQLTCGVFIPRKIGKGALRVTADGNLLIQQSLDLKPESPFTQTVTCPVDTDEVRVTVVDASGQTVLTHQKFFGKRPRKVYELPEKPWHRKTPLTTARWQEAFTPLMAWGPWYHPPTSYAEILKTEPANKEALIGRARSLIKEASGDLFRARKESPDKLREEAASILNKFAEAHTTDARILNLLALVQMQQGQREAAAATLQRLVKNPTSGGWVHYQLALVAGGAKDWTTAAREAQAAVDQAPDSTLARLLLAIAMAKTNRANSVHEIIAPILRSNPLEVGALILEIRAARSEKNGELAERIEARLAKIKQLAPEQHQAGVAQIESLEKGEDLDCLAINTILGSPSLPGRSP